MMGKKAINRDENTSIYHDQCDQEVWDTKHYQVLLLFPFIINNLQAFNQELH